jgi:hypothetical protein
MRILVLVLLLILLSSCASTPEVRIEYRTKIVETPIYQIPEFNIPPRPLLPTELLKDTNRGDHNAIGRAYIASKKILEGYVVELTNILEGIKSGN